MADFFRYADTNGDGTGLTNANVDGSITPVVFKLEARGDEDGLEVARLIAFVRDTGSFDSGSYGNGVAMTNGITIGVYDANDILLTDILDGKAILTNVDWKRASYDITVSTFGAGSEAMSIRWTFTAAGEPITLRSGRYIGVTINDNLTGLQEHTFQFQGKVIP